MENIWNRFLSFESHYNLFNLKDENGVYIWDIVRFNIYIDILWGNNPTTTSKTKKHRDYLHLVITLFYYFKSLFVKGDYVFFLASRNKNDKKLIDKNAYNALQNLPANKIVAIESYANCFSSDLSYQLHLLLPLLPFGFISKLQKKQNYDFTPILSLVRTEFPESKIDTTYLNTLYRLFYIQRRIYRFLFRRWGTQKVFLTQNGLQKGLIAACHDLGIPIYEFQHGIVDQGHIAYSYPTTNIANVYLPNKIIAFSEFWFKDCILPFVCKTVPIGNDYFVPSKNGGSNNSVQRKGKILVVSADVFGVELANFVEQCMADPILKDYKFYFKLHPNQFNEYDYFSTLFSDNNNIVIVRNEKDIPTLVGETEAMLTIQSTAVYEGLQKGTSIYILKRSSYRRQAHLFTLQNVFLIDTVSDFRNNIIQHPLTSGMQENTPIFFTPFNVDLFRKEFVDE